MSAPENYDVTNHFVRLTPIRFYRDLAGLPTSTGPVGEPEVFWMGDTQSPSMPTAASVTKLGERNARRLAMISSRVIEASRRLLTMDQLPPFTRLTRLDCEWRIAADFHSLCRNPRRER